MSFSFRVYFLFPTRILFELFAKVFFTLRNREQFALVLFGVFCNHVVVRLIIVVFRNPEFLERLVGLLDGLAIDAPSHEVRTAASR